MSTRNVPAPSGRIQYLRRITWLMDQGIRVPGTNFRFGLDPILGLVPGLGDAAGAIISGVMLMEAVRNRAATFTLIRMSGNIALDALIGAVPVVGDLFDFGWKANTRNLELLERHLESPVEAHGSDRRHVLVVGALIALVTGLVIGGGILLVWLLVFRLLSR